MSNSLKITQFTLNGEFVRDWDSTREAEAALNGGYGTIKRCLLGKVKSAYGYVWKYVDDVQECSDLMCTADMAAAELVEIAQNGCEEEVEAFIANPCEETLERCGLPVIAHLYLDEIDGYTVGRRYKQLAKTTKKRLSKTQEKSKNEQK